MTRTLLYEYYQKACSNGMGLVFAANCASAIATRLDRRLSFDCDEFRALQGWAFCPETMRPKAIDTD